MTGTSPAAEVAIDERLVRALLRQQFPAVADRPLERVAHGWDNDVYRLGSDLAVRLPRRQVAADLVEHEQRWLGRLGPRLPLPVPAPVLAGRPALGYPWAWSVVPWFDGDIAARTPPADPDDAAATLARFLLALHQPAPPDAPANPVRGVPLAQRDQAVAERLALLSRPGPGPGPLAPHGGAVAVAAAWAEALQAPVWVGPPLWLHGDLHPANILVSQGRLHAVIDFGDLTAGDSATDLAVAWMLFDPPARARFRATYDAAAPLPDPARWARARGWALNLAIAILASSADQPAMAALAHRTLAATLAETG